MEPLSIGVALSVATKSYGMIKKTIEAGAEFEQVMGQMSRWWGACQDISKANYFAGHSLGEYSALACSGVINFRETIKLLKTRVKAMQNAVPKGEGGMLAVLGSTVEILEEIGADMYKISSSDAASFCFNVTFCTRRMWSF